MMGCLVSGLFFMRFWSRTRDRLFLIFACALMTLAGERILLACAASQADEEHSLIYIVRLMAFLLILYGILDKNLAEKKRAR